MHDLINNINRGRHVLYYSYFVITIFWEGRSQNGKTVKPNSTWNDTQLVDAYKKGVQDAWDILCKRHQKYLRRHFFRKGITNPEDLNDLVQETFLEAMRNIEQIHSPHHFPSWLVQVAIGKLSRWFEKEERSRKIQDNLRSIVDASEAGDIYEPAYLEPQQQAIDAEYLRIITSMIDRFPPSQEKVFRMLCNGMTNTQVASELDIKVNAVNVRLSKARRKLRNWIETEYPEVFTDLVDRGVI